MSPRATRSDATRAAALDLGGRGRGRYLYWSKRPLHTLAFIAPLILAYEISSAWILRSGGAGAQTIRAHRLLGEMFDLFGVQGMHLPAALAIVTLLAWHVLTRDPWRLRLRVLAAMPVETVAWTAPLLVLGVIGVRVLGLDQPTAAAVAEAAAIPSWGERVTIALGAGVYEELLFRLVGITAIHLVVVDLLGFKNRAGWIVALAGSSLAFSLYHDVAAASGAVEWGRLIYFFLAGAYFGVVFLFRGFGIAVGVHALYDLIVLLRPIGDA